MEKSSVIMERILDLLSNSVWGLSIEEISKKLNLHRNTVSKYLKKLEVLGLVVKKSVGKYSFWLSRSIYNYYKTNTVRLFLEALLDFLIEKNFSDEEIEELGERMAIYAISNVREKIESGKSVKVDQNLISNLFNLYIPTIIPRLRVRISITDFSEKLILVYFDGCPNNVKNFKKICSFLLGFVKGFLKTLNLGKSIVNFVESNKEKGICKFSILLEREIGKILEDLKFNQ